MIKRKLPDQFTESKDFAHYFKKLFGFLLTFLAFFYAYKVVKLALAALKNPDSLLEFRLFAKYLNADAAARTLNITSNVEGQQMMNQIVVPELFVELTLLFLSLTILMIILSLLKCLFNAGIILIKDDYSRLAKVIKQELEKQKL